MKQYILSIFLLSAAFSLHAMDEGSETSSEPIINLHRSADGKAIVAERVTASFDGYTVHHTTVTKNIATGTFDAKAGCIASAGLGVENMSYAADPKTVEMLKLRIAEFESEN